MTGDLVLIVLKIKLIVIGQLERRERRSQGKPYEDVCKRATVALGGPQATALLTSSPLGIRRLEMIMILSSLSNVTTSATQLGAQEWLMYLDGRTESGSEIQVIPTTWPRRLKSSLSPGRASGQGGVDHMLIVYPKHVNATVLERQSWRSGMLVSTLGSRLSSHDRISPVFSLPTQLSNCLLESNLPPCS